MSDSAPARALCTLRPVDEFAALAPRWDALNDAHFRHLLLDSRFVTASLEYMAGGRENIAVYGDPRNPDAIAVVAPQRLGTWATLQTSQAPLGAIILRPDVALGDFVAALFRALPPSCQVLSLTQQDPDISPRPAEEAVLSTLDYIRTARITVDGDFESYWSRRGKNLRRNMKRQMSRLERDGVTPRVTLLDDPAQMHQGVESYGALESAGWKAERGTAVSIDNNQGAFYVDLLRAYAATGNARIYQYFFDDRLCATDLCLFDDGALIILKTTYDESISDVSPALLMRYAYLPPLFDAGQTRRIEFYGKVMDWHTKWSDEIRMLYHVNTYRSPITARLHGALRRRA